MLHGLGSSCILYDLFASGGVEGQFFVFSSCFLPVVLILVCDRVFALWWGFGDSWISAC